MGLGIYIKAEINTPISFSAIRNCILKNTHGLFRDLLSFNESENAFYASLHPCEESVCFEYVNASIICSARTTSVGPGYHAYVVELIEKIGTELEVNWVWNLEEGDDYYCDETGYFDNRNFEQLQFEMLNWLKAIAKSSIEDTQNEKWMLTMPVGYPKIKRNYFAVSPLGFWTREFFKKIAESKLVELEWAGQDFFIWWNKEDNAQFYKKTGIALVNVECPWHFAADDNEKKLLNNINNCFDNAKRLDPQINLPLVDWAAVKNLIDEEDTEIPDTGFGYKKHLMGFDLPGKWMIDLPGNLYHTEDENSEVYYDHDRNIRIICYTRNDDKNDEEFAHRFFNGKDYPGAEFLSSATDIAGKAIVYYKIDKALEQEYWILQGVKVKDNKFVFTTICFPTEDFKQWAVETWNSIRR